MELNLPDMGSVPKIVTCTIEGVLEPEDLAALVSGPVEGATPAVPKEVEDPTNLKKIRERHHGVARNIAAGMSQSLVASMCGYTDSYLSILLNNPAMQELVGLYRQQHNSSAVLIAEGLRSVGMKAVERIAERLDEEGEGAVTDIHELTAIAKLGLDRSGHGPASTTTVVKEDHIIDHAKLLELNQRAKSASREYIVPVAEVRAALTPPTIVEAEFTDAPEADDEAA